MLYRYLVDRDNFAQVARINFYRLDLNSFVQNIYKNVFGLSVGALEIVSLIFWKSCPAANISVQGVKL